MSNVLFKLTSLAWLKWTVERTAIMEWIWFCAERWIKVRQTQISIEKRNCSLPYRDRIPMDAFMNKLHPKRNLLKRTCRKMKIRQRLNFSTHFLLLRSFMVHRRRRHTCIAHMPRFNFFTKNHVTYFTGVRESKRRRGKGRKERETFRNYYIVVSPEDRR